MMEIIEPILLIQLDKSSS